MRLASVVPLLFLSLLHCKPPVKPTNEDPTAETYLALGDSYTIGESVAESERWPVLLAKRKGWGAPEIIATTGWRSDQLLSASANAKRQTYDHVSVLIGVNDQFQGKSVDSFRANFRKVLDVAQSKTDTSNVFVLTIPDYGVTPFAASRNAKQIGEEIDRFNQIVIDESKARGIRVYDVTPISREASSDRSLIAGDGLHPSGTMYQRWVELILS